jgi:hypothetical protein
MCSCTPYKSGHLVIVHREQGVGADVDMKDRQVLSCRACQVGNQTSPLLVLSIYRDHVRPLATTSRHIHRRFHRTDGRGQTRTSQAKGRPLLWWYVDIVDSIPAKMQMIVVQSALSRRNIANLDLVYRDVRSG